MMGKSPRSGTSAKLVAIGLALGLSAGGMLTPAIAQQTGQAGSGTAPAANSALSAALTQCFGATDARQITQGCDVVLGGGRGGLTNDQTGLALQRRGAARAQLERVDEAIADFRQMAQLGYRVHEAQASIGGLEFRRQNLAAAEQGYRDALKANPSYALALAGLGHTLIALGRASEAVGQFDRAITSGDTEAGTHLGRGSALLATGDPDSAIRSFGEAIRIAPNLAAARYQRAQALSDRGNTAQALADIDHVLSRETGLERVRALAIRGRLRNAAKAHEGAAADCGTALADADRLSIRDASLRAAAHICIALARQGRGELAQAKDSYDAALRLEPRDITALAGRGYISLQRGLYDEAIADFEAVLRIDARSEDALRFLGLALADKGDLAKAEDAIRRATEANPRDPWPIMIRAVSLAKAGVRERALADVERAQALVGQATSDTHLVRGAVHYFLEDLERSRAELETSVRLNGENAQAHRLMARIHLRQGRIELARQELATAERGLPGDATIALTRAQIAVSQRDFATALREAGLSLSLNAAHAEPYAARGQAHEGAGQSSEAAADYEVALTRLATDPDGQRAQRLARERLAALRSVSTSRPATASVPTSPSRPADRPAQTSIYCQAFEGVFVHSRRYTGVEFDVGCR